MKKIILLLMASLLTFMLIAVRYFYSQNFEKFKKEIRQYESEQIAKIIEEKEKRIKTMLNDDPQVLYLFIDHFDVNKSITRRDTSFSFFYLSGSCNYKSVSFKYIDCLLLKCRIDVQNGRTQKLIAAKEKELEKKFEKTFNHWYPKLKDTNLVLKSKKESDCNYFISDIYEIIFNEIAWNEFEKFMTSYNSEIKKIKKENQLIEDQFAYYVNSTKNQLNIGILRYFEEQISNKKSQIITTKSETISYSSPSLGHITYDIDRKIFNKEGFQNVAQDAFEEQWKYNSLISGAMPYSSCYGSNNYCGGWNCSEIKVITGGSGDVLVLIKNSSDRVVRHCYISGGNSFTFNVPNGKYQVFFYSGKGWNPNKAMPSSYCNSLKGGFVSNESVTKDTYITLDNQIITYKLTPQQHGNFSPKSSSKSEAF